MRTWLWTIGAAGLLMVSIAAGAADYGSSPPPSGSAPPVAQPLVREGDLAIRLAAELDLGTPSDEAVAEDMLVKAGVSPLNGWLSDYPVTPQIIGQLQESVSRAASEGKLPMTSDQAVKGLFALAAGFGLPNPADQGPAASTAQNAPPAPTYPSDQQVINNYYYDAGPPIVTYYPPPYDYVYLYDWVPYPVWWFGFWFPGFYICHDFSTVVVYQYRPVVVSNHFIDRDTRTVVRVDPVGTRERNGRRPETVLRTGQGERFRTFGDLHRGTRMNGPAAEGRPGEGDHAARDNGRYGSAEARRSAASIYSRSTARIPVPWSRDLRAESGSRTRDSRLNLTEPPERGTQRAWRARNWPLPSEQRPSSPRTKENDSVWGGQSSGPDRSWRTPQMTSPDLPRGLRPLNGIGGDSRPPRSYPGGYWRRQDMNGTFPGNPGVFGSGYCRGKC